MEKISIAQALRHTHLGSSRIDQIRTGYGEEVGQHQAHKQDKKANDFIN